MSDTIIAGLSLLVSAINAVLYFRLQGKYNEMTKTQTSTAQGAIETQVRNSISDATKEVLHYATEVEKNAYEDACAKYLDRKIDVERFEKIYKQ